MSKFNFTSPWANNKVLNLLFVFCFTLFSSQAIAQCAMGCTGSVQVSLDNANCAAEITAVMILNDQTTTCPAGVFEVTIEDHHGNYIAGYNAADPAASTLPIVNSSHVGIPLYAVITDVVSGNSCWGDLVVEDKLAPILTCTDVTLSCYEAAVFAPPAIDNCDVTAVITLVSDVVQVNDCNSGLSEEILKVHTLTYIAEDASGNVSLPCTMTATILRLADLNDIHCPANNLLADNTNLVCDSDYPELPDGNPVPRGFFDEVLAFEGAIELTDPVNPDLPAHLMDEYDLEYVANTGDCDLVTFTKSVGLLLVVFDHEGNQIGLSNTFDPLTVSLCNNERYTIRVSNNSAPTAYPYVLSISAAGNAGNFVPDVPHLPNGTNLYPDPNLYCNILTSFTDTDLGYIGCTHKIMRTWLILEWSCSDPQRSRTCVQMIEISDSVAPEFTCPSDMTVTTNISGGNYTSSTGTNVSCARLMTPPAINPLDNCTNPVTIDIDYPGGFIDDYDGTQQMELPVGENDITYIVSDGCYNSSECTFTVTVEDNTPPVAICTQFTVVSLSIDGIAHVYASVFDNGSYDDCHMDKVLVKRMDNGSNCGIVENTFEEFATFCCADIGTPVMVQLRVYDLNGNYNECMVEVEVQDKIGPSIVCPANLNMDCDVVFNLNGDLNAQFGGYTVTDNCGFTVTDVATANLDQCNTGRITRTITATDDGGRTTTCTQFIDLTNPSPFNGATDINWPLDINAPGCSDPSGGDFHPDNTGYPTYLEDQCDLVGANYDDLVFPFNNGAGDACFKILRTWSVIDWCQFSGGVYPRWEYTQVIKVTNSIAPVITSDCAPKSTCTFDVNCADGFIELTATATDDCTDVLGWLVEIDLNSDGSFDDSVSGTGSLADASNDYPIGDHTAFYSFEDLCGNVATCSQQFSIISCKTPTPYCINGIATDLMPVGTDWGMIELWASDFDLGSFHDCGYDVVVSFSADPTNTNMTFDCNTQGQQNVTIYSTALDASGNPLTLPDGSLVQAFCNTYVDIQDNMMVCPTNVTTRLISGHIATEDNQDVMDVEVALGDGVNYEMTTQDGDYTFPAMPTGGNYAVEPELNDDPMNGVSTLDLVLIQKHILGLRALPSAYKIIAGDINHDENITAIDLVELRKMILGIQTDFSVNESWRFVDAAYTFVDATDPLTENFTEVYTVADLSQDMVIDFTAVKIGDVNNSSVTNLTGINVTNRTDDLKLYTDNLAVAKGDKVSIPFKAADALDLLGYQFTIGFDSDAMSFQGYTSGVLNVQAENFGTQRADQGVVTTSWAKVEATDLAADATLFTLEFIANTDMDLSDVLNINSEITTAEAYNTLQEVLGLELEIRDAKVNGFVLHQNTPNPFTNATVIGFELPTTQNVSLTIYDVTGKVVSAQRATYNAGYNSITINQEVLSTSGILYYTVETDNHSATKKMVVLK